MGARAGGLRSVALLAVIAVRPLADAGAQNRLEIPFVPESGTLGQPAPPSPTLTRTCRFVLRITGATRADVRGWKFSLGANEMSAFGSAGDDQPAAYLAIVPKDAPDPVPLTLSGAPEAAVASLDTLELPTTDPAGAGRCPDAPAGGLAPDRRADAAPSRQTVQSYPRVYDRSRRMANLRFNRFGLPDTNAAGRPEKFPAGITDNDMITVFLALPDSVPVNGYSVQVSGNIKGEEVNVLGEGEVGEIPGFPQGAEAGAVRSVLYSMGTFGPYSAPQVTVRIVRTAGDDTVVDRSYTLRVRRTYVAALRLGVARSGVRFHDFQAGPRSSADTTRIIRDLNAGRDREVRPYLTLVFYGWRFWEKGFWDGRDIEAEPAPEERLNPMVGAGLEELGDEWLVGFSFEVARGLDLNLAYQAAKVSVLQSGFAAGGAFTGTGAPPTSEEWESGVSLGASVDLRVVSGVLSGLLSNSR